MLNVNVATKKVLIKEKFAYKINEINSNTTKKIFNTRKNDE